MTDEKARGILSLSMFLLAAIFITTFIIAERIEIGPVQESTTIKQEPTGAIIYYKCNIDTLIENDEVYLIKFKN